MGDVVDMEIARVRLAAPALPLTADCPECSKPSEQPGDMCAVCEVEFGGGDDGGDEYACNFAEGLEAGMIVGEELSALDFWRGVVAGIFIGVAITSIAGALGFWEAVGR